MLGSFMNFFLKQNNLNECEPVLFDKEVIQTGRNNRNGR